MRDTAITSEFSSKIQLKVKLTQFSSEFVVHLFQPQLFFLPLNFLIIYLDMALCKQPASI